MKQLYTFLLVFVFSSTYSVRLLMNYQDACHDIGKRTKYEDGEQSSTNPNCLREVVGESEPVNIGVWTEHLYIYSLPWDLKLRPLQSLFSLPNPYFPYPIQSSIATKSSYISPFKKILFNDNILNSKYALLIGWNQFLNQHKTSKPFPQLF